MKRGLLLTGAGGMLGQELMKQLSEHQEYIIYALTSNPEFIVKHFPFCKIVAREAYEEVLSSYPIDTVLHCAFSRSMEEKCLQDSINYTSELFYTAKNHNVPHLINISSRSVYGQISQLPWNEDMRPEPNSPYAHAKYKTEQIVSSYSNSDTNVTSIRLAGLIGPIFEERLPNKLIKLALSQKRLKIEGGKQLFAYLDIRDAAAGIIQFIGSNYKKWDEVYNLGPQRAITILELAQEAVSVLKEQQNISVELQFTPSDISLYDGMDCQRFYKLTKWLPKYSIKEMLVEIFLYEFYKNNSSGVSLS